MGVYKKMFTFMEETEHMLDALRYCNFVGNAMEDEDYLDALEAEIEDKFKKIFKDGVPLPKSKTQDESQSDSDIEDLLDKLDNLDGFELEEDSWENDPVKKSKRPTCECGLGTDEPCSQHFTWCKCYLKE